MGFFFFFSQLRCLLRFQNSPQTRLWEGFLLFGNLSFFTTPSPGQVFVLNSFVSLSVFYILSYLLLKRGGCLSGWLVSSASVQKLFCGSCSAFKWSFDKFVGEKAVSLSYSSAILGPPPYQWFFFFNCNSLTMTQTAFMNYSKQYINTHIAFVQKNKQHICYTEDIYQLINHSIIK